MGPELLHHIDGMFSFVLYDSKKDVFFAARDHVGITTLYYGTRPESNGKTSVWFASEMKSLNEDCSRILAFPPGSYYLGYGDERQPDQILEYYRPQWYNHKKLEYPSLDAEQETLSPEQETAMYTAIRESLEKSVQKRLMSDVPYGVLLSGGLDSSLIASIAVRQKRAIEGTVRCSDEDIQCMLLHFF